MKLEFDPDYVPGVKLGLHCFQIIFSFVAWCLEIAVFKNKDAKITGQNGWTFGVMFISIPAWVFLIMTPRFGRTRKFAQPHAMLATDAIMCLLWLTAFATQASYNSGDKCGSACGISKAIVGLGVFITLFFGGSTFVSAYTLTYFNFHGNLPGYDNRKIRGGENIDPDKAAFSMAPHDEEAYERVNADDHEPSGAGGYGNYDDPRYGNANPYSAEDDDPSRYGTLPPRHDALFDSETAYRPGGSPAPASMPYANPPMDDRLDDRLHDPYDDHAHPAQFPSGNYDRTH